MTDFDQYVRSLRQTIISLFDLSTASWAAQLAGGGDPDDKPDEETAKTVARVKELLPTEEELERHDRRRAGQIIVNEHGLTYRGDGIAAIGPRSHPPGRWQRRPLLK